MKKNFIEDYNKEFRAFALSKIFESSDKSIHIHILRREGELKQFSDMLKFFNDKVEVIVYPAWDCCLIVIFLLEKRSYLKGIVL